MLKEDVTIDPEEAKAELGAAQEEWDSRPERFDESGIRREFRTLQDAATMRRYGQISGVISYAAIPIDEITPPQIRLVPAMLEYF
jgi:hypothetical protein